MATKDSKARDEDEDDDLEDEEEDDDDPDAGEPVPAGQPVKSSPKPIVSARAPARSSRDAGRGKAAASAKHGGHAKDDHGHGHSDAIDDEAQDPSWWTPYAVLGAIVVVGVLGFFGAFTSALKPLVPGKPYVPAHEEPVAAAPPEPAPAPAPPAKKGPAGADDAETFGAKHLLVMYKGSRRAPPTIERSKEDALARAKEALAKAKAPGAKFEDLVGEYSDEPGAGKRGGNLGNFKRGAMVKEFQDALDKMKVGDISDVVETPFGYHVIQRTK